MTDDDLDQTQAAPIDRETPCQLRTGRAGTGKTYQILELVRDDPSYGLLTSTTGVSAVNMGAITLNSTLKYFDTSSMRDSFLAGHLSRILHQIAIEYSWLIVDEVSMMDGEQLDILYRGVEEANRYADIHRPLGILLVGDFAQLPPVRAKWAFEASCWERFAANTTRLEKVWRQDQGPFLDALNLARAGRGVEAAEVLSAAGARWETQVHAEFEGTTILPKNKMVNRYNELALDRVAGREFTVSSRRWGQQRSEWGENRMTHEWGIPPSLRLRVGAYVTIKANASDFSVVNGDCGHIVAYVPATEHDAEHLIVHLIRTGQEINVYKLVRGVESSERPDVWSGMPVPKDQDDGEYIPKPHYRGRVRRYVLGQVEYFPVALAYASTVHRSQSLTLDRVQVDYRDNFFSSPAMLYTALSRCRTLEGLRLVGQPERFASACKIDPKVREYL
jgi:ATP-dependent DNA helicase PIF1